MKKQLFANLFSRDLGMADLTAFDNTQALEEGWEIRDVTEDDDEGEGPFNLISMAPSKFVLDLDAAEYVMKRAAEGSDYHLGALQFLAIHSPGEFACTVKHRA